MTQNQRDTLAIATALGVLQLLETLNHVKGSGPNAERHESRITQLQTALFNLNDPRAKP